MNSIVEKIQKGLALPQGKRIMHTSPHHDDEMLAYYPILPQLLKTNQNSFVYITSGHHSVTDDYMFKELYATPEFIIQYPPQKRTFLDLVCRVYEILDLHSLREKIHALKTAYVPNTEEIKILKGAIRELEAEKMLLDLGVDPANIHHLRAAFYDGGDSQVDAEHLKALVEEVRPDIVTVAYDPRDKGPKTHFHSLEVILRAIEMSPVKPEIWFYRNVWSRFTLEEADLLIPVNEDGMESMNRAFLTHFKTQKIAAFPSKEFSGPFSKLSEKIQREQFEEIKKQLGEVFFRDNSDLRIRNAAGFIFLKTLK